MSQTSASATAFEGDEPTSNKNVELDKSDEKQPTTDPSVDKEKGDESQQDVDDKVYPPMRKVLVIMAALYIAFFLVSLDRSILATAVPEITDAFHSLTDIGWYASAYTIVSCAFQLTFGRIYTFYVTKWVFIGNLFIFVIGSIISAAAPTSPAFIIGRAVSGLGSAGVMAGAVVLMVNLLPLHKRPTYGAPLFVVLVLSSVVGPLIGGAFTSNQHLTWRWCFYLNIPVGGFSILVMSLLLPSSPPFATTPGAKAASNASTGAKENVQTSQPEETPATTHKATIWEQIIRLDPVGTFFFLPSMICLLLALQWGGTTYAWNDGRIIALFVLFGALFIAFAVSQAYNKELALVPPRILAYRGVTASAWWAFGSMASLTIVSYYLPTWFQAIQGVDAFDSGIRLLPLLIASFVSGFIAGPSVGKIGYYTPFLIAGSCIMAIGGGLLTTLKTDSSRGIWIGYQVIFGFGAGLGQQQAGLVAQTILPDKDVPTGIAIKFLGQFLGAAVFVSVGQNVLTTELTKRLSGIEGLDAQVIVTLGATELRDYVTKALGPDFLQPVLEAYNDSLCRVFLVAAIMGAVSLTGALLTEWRSVKGRKKQGPF